MLTAVPHHHPHHHPQHHPIHHHHQNTFGDLNLGRPLAPSFRAPPPPSVLGDGQAAEKKGKSFLESHRDGMVGKINTPEDDIRRAPRAPPQQQQQQQEQAQQAQVPPAPILEGVLIHKRWRIMHVLGKGAFGEVHAGFDTQTNAPVAIKIEPPSSKKQVLKLEVAILRKLANATLESLSMTGRNNGNLPSPASEDELAVTKSKTGLDPSAAGTKCPWFADFYGSGRFAISNGPVEDPDPEPESNDMSPEAQERAAKKRAVVAAMKASLPVYTFMVMELLGPNLSEIRRNAPEHRFPPSVIADIGVQMLHGIQSLHAIGVVHRDIKPGNFCVGVDYTPEKGLVGQRVYMIDFGLSRKFVSGGGIIREARQKVGFRGTSRYASLRAHKGQDLGPVDDLWTFFYLLVEFTTGSLPWKGKEKDRIAIVKGQYHDAPLGTEGHITFGLPEPLVEMWKYLAQLDYADMVDYARIEGLVYTLRTEKELTLERGPTSTTVTDPTQLQKSSLREQITPPSLEWNSPLIPQAVEQQTRNIVDAAVRPTPSPLEEPAMELPTSQSPSPSPLPPPPPPHPPVRTSSSPKLTKKNESPQTSSLYIHKNKTNIAEPPLPSLPKQNPDLSPRPPASTPPCTPFSRFRFRRYKFR